MYLHPEFGVNPTVLTCFLCGEGDSLLLLGRNGGREAPKSVTHYTIKGKRDHPSTKHTHICQSCQDLQEKGIMLIEVKDDDQNYRTGRMFVITDEVCERIFTGVDFGKRAAFIPVSVVEAIGLDKIDPTYENRDNIPGT